MTACEDIRRQLNALLDGELSADESSVANAHLQSCDTCQREWEALQSVDARLQRLLTIDDLADRVATVQQIVQTMPLPARSRATTLRWSALIAALAASVLIAFFATRPDKLPQPMDPRREVVAHLVRATGPIEIQSPGVDTWTSVESIASYEVEKGARLRTGESVLVEVLTSSDSRLRLNESAEMVLHNARQLELVKGQLWVSAPDVEVSVDVPIQHDQSRTIATMKCPAGSEYQCEAGNDFAACDSVSAENPLTQWAMGAFTCAVAPGETVSIDGAQNVDRKAVAASSKIWQLPLLAIGHSVDDEFLSSMKGLLAPIGMTKARHLNEQQIRRLGPQGAVPLLAFVHAESDPQQLGLRRTAINIAADLADERSIELLQKIKSDPDAYISRRAATALEKVAKQAK